MRMLPSASWRASLANDRAGLRGSELYLNWSKQHRCYSLIHYGRKLGQCVPLRHVCVRDSTEQGACAHGSCGQAARAKLSLWPIHKWWIASAGKVASAGKSVGAFQAVLAFKRGEGGFRVILVWCNDNNTYAPQTCNNINGMTQ